MKCTLLLIVICFCFFILHNCSFALSFDYFSDIPSGYELLDVFHLLVQLFDDVKRGKNRLCNAYNSID